MRYLTEIGQKWGESGALFVAAFLSSFFLLFILIEPLFSIFYQSKQWVESQTIQAQIRNEPLNSQNANPNTAQMRPPLEAAKEFVAIQNSEKEAPVEQKAPAVTEQAAKPLTPSNTEMEPNRFAFNAVPNIESPNSAPILGGRSGFRSRAPSAPGPKKDRDSISDQALADYRNQVGQEVDKRHAQAELAQLMGSLDAEEEYQCTIRGDSKNNQKPAKEAIKPTVQCKPNSPKASFLEAIIKRLFADEACAYISASKSQGLQKRTCIP